MRRIAKGMLSLASLLIVFSTIGLGAINDVSTVELPPSDVITCQSGCRITQSDSNYIIWVKAGSSFTIKAGDGWDSYIWIRNDGKQFSGSILKDTINEDAVYVLTLKLGAIVKTKQVEVKLPSSVQNTCLPDVSEIDLNNGFTGNTFPIGSTILAKVTLSNKYNCPNYKVTWESDAGDALETEQDSTYPEQARIYVLSQTDSGKNPPIKVNVSNGFSSIIKERTIIIIDYASLRINSIEIIPEMPLSFNRVKFICTECFSGNMKDRFTEFTVTVKSIDEVFDRTASFSKSTATATMTMGEEGLYTLEIFGKNPSPLTKIHEEEIGVGFGNTMSDKPPIIVREPSLCVALVCTIIVEEIDSERPDVFLVYEVRTVAGFEPLNNINGKPCVSYKCDTAFLKAGTYEIRVTGHYKRNGKASGAANEVTVYAVAGEQPSIGQTVTEPSPVFTQPNPAATQMSSVQPVATYLPVSTPREGYDRPKIPALDSTSVIVVILISWRLKKQKQKQKF